MDMFYTRMSGASRSFCYKILALLLCLSLLLGMVIYVGAANTSNNVDIDIDSTISGTASGAYKDKSVFYISLAQDATSFTLKSPSGIAATTTDDGSDGSKLNVAISKGDSNYNAAKAYYETSKSNITGVNALNNDLLLFRLSIFDWGTFTLVVKG